MRSIRQWFLDRVVDRPRDASGAGKRGMMASRCRRVMEGGLPSGRAHDRINFRAFVALGAASAVAFATGALPTPPVSVVYAFSIGYFVGSHYLSPDLDAAGSEPKRRWGWLRVVWVPYARIFRHRGSSHGYLIGPLTRLAYLFVIASPVMAREEVHAWVTQHQPLIAGEAGTALLIGYFTSTWLHLIADRAPLRL
jgi:uncharacterized metal-binding protein